MGLPVTQLAEKLELLVTHGAQENMDAIARALDKKRSTIRWWASREHPQGRGLVSKSGVDPLIDLFAQALPDLERSHVRALLCGPIDDLETYFRAGSIAVLTRVIKDHADTSSGRLIPEDQEPREMGVIETNKKTRYALQHRVPLETYFRIEFPTRAVGRYAYGLLNCDHKWQFIECWLNDTGTCIHLPDLDENGKLAMIRVLVTPIPHRFVAIQTNKPMPAEVLAASQENTTLDRPILSQIARFYEAQPKSTRRLFAMDVDIGKKEKTEPYD